MNLLLPTGLIVEIIPQCVQIIKFQISWPKLHEFVCNCSSFLLPFPKLSLSLNFLRRKKFLDLLALQILWLSAVAMVLRGALTIIIRKFQNAIVHRRSRTRYHEILRMRALENRGYIICPSRDRFATVGMISRKMKLSSDRLMPKLNNYLDPPIFKIF